MKNKKKMYPKGGVVTQRINALEERIDKLEHALITLASWNESGEWQGAHAYLCALLDIPTQQSQEESRR